MAEIVKNNKNFLVIKLSKIEYVAVSDSFGMCDICNNFDINNNFYYIAILDQFYCETCYNAWYSGATHYKVDMQKERNFFYNIEKKLKAMGVL